MLPVKKKRIKHDYTDELELKSLIIRINNRERHENDLCYVLDNSPESIKENAIINRYIKLYIKLKGYKSESLSRKAKLRKQRSELKELIITESEKVTIDHKSFEQFGVNVLLMIKSILTKPNFATLGYDAEFYEDSTYKISKYIHNFDHKKISPISGLPGNAFAYISQYIHNSFLFICNKKRDEKAQHSKQVNMEMLDDNQSLKYVDLHVDDRTRFHTDKNTIRDEIVNINTIGENKSLLSYIKEIHDVNVKDFDDIGTITINYPSDYRITMEEFDAMKPYLNGKMVIKRSSEERPTQTKNVME